MRPKIDRPVPRPEHDGGWDLRGELIPDDYLKERLQKGSAISGVCGYRPNRSSLTETGQGLT